MCFRPGSFFNELFVAVNPFAKTEPRTRVECTAAAVDIVDGIVKLDPGFVIRTDKVDISAYGSVDLGSEKIDLKFKNSPRKGIGLSATGLVKPYIKVGGSLAKPALTLDAPSALLSGTAAVATGGLSILVTGLFDRISTAANPCEAAIRRADSGKAPSTVKSQDAR